MTRIKICGITNGEDARAACALGADVLGFVFVPQSPRYVGGDVARARELMQAVPPLVWRVGLFDVLPPSFDDLPELHAVQYYQGGDGAAFAGACAPMPIKVYRVRGRETLDEIASDVSPRKLIMLDAYTPGKLGGTGHTFNWDVAIEAKNLGLPLVLAGGLTPENVADAVRQVRPYLVDVSSGVEAEPGRKDHVKLRRFIQAVRAVDLEIAGAET